MEKKYGEDLQHIRQMMQRGSRFLSLSGLSGVFAGATALVGAAYVYYLFRSRGVEYFNSHSVVYEPSFLRQLAYTAIIILAVALAGAYYFTVRKSRRKGERVWDMAAKNLLYYFSIPLVAGGLVCLGLYYHGFFVLIAPIMLLFYGFSLLLAAQYTYSEVVYVGLTEIVLGLLSLFFLGWGLLFWTLGFGVVHIVYGFWMYRKYDRS